MFNYYIPTRILFGKGALGQLGQQALPGKKALIVTTAGQSVKKNGYLAALQAQLDEAGVTHLLFDKVLPNPILPHVREGAQLCRENHCDFVVGLGGGSSIDTAKAIAVMSTNPGDYWDYIPSGTGKGQPLQAKPLPIVAVTTTAGTGTETDPWTVTTNPETNEKIGFGCEGTFPALAIVDPALMMTVPRHLTAYQGFDALFHSTEGYLANLAYVMSDLYAEKAIQLIGKSLAKAVNDGADEQARADVALANTLSGLVESTSSCISEHALEHAMSAFHPKLPHGAGLIMISAAYYTHFAQTGQCDDRMVAMAKALGKEDAACAMDFVTALVDLQKACGVDQLKMSDYGITQDELPALVENAYAINNGTFSKDPIELTPEDCLKIYQRSYR